MNYERRVALRSLASARGVLNARDPDRLAATPITPSAIVHALAGSPPAEGAGHIEAMEPRQPRRCAVCAGVPERALPYERWQGSNFSGQAELAWPGAPWVCEPCAWAMSWVAPPDRPQEPAPGKRRVRSLRMYAHLWSEAGGYWSAERGDLSRVREWLRDPKRHEESWFAAIPIGGQKHILPATPLNAAGADPGWVRFEEQTVAIGDWSLCDEMGALLAARVRRAEIETGEYSIASWRSMGRELLAFERHWSRVRASGWFALALWLAGDRGERDGSDDAGEG